MTKVGSMRARRAIVVVATAAVIAAPSTAASAEPLPDFTRTVTLITGDRLQVAPDGTAASRLPSPGRDGIPLISRYAAGRLQVVPADAAPLLGADRLDERLFDVTGLLESGYDDTRGDLPLIVTYSGRSAASAVGAAAGGAPVQDLSAVNGSAVRVSTPRLAAAWAALSTGDLGRTYRKIWLDGIARPSADEGVPLVGAPAAWAQGLTGGGVPVGLLDTGVDTDHPDLAGTIAEAADFTGGDEVDRSGHGTHVVSIIAGSGAASGGRYRGMAPDARIFSAKVCEAGRCPESAVLEAMLWAARDKNLKVVNLSLGMPDRPGTDLLEQAVDDLTRQYGTLFVAAAGNTGPISSPASAAAALSVAVTGAGRPADLSAPGTGIVAARSGDSARLATGPGGRYTRASGSSVATPHVTGAAAILAQQHPDWSPAAIKAALIGSATAMPDDDPGRLDVARAVSSPVTAASDAAAGTVTYTNSGRADVTLALSSSDPAVTLTDTTLTVPAGGRATTRVVAAGVLTAASGDISVRTPLGAGPAPGTVALTVRFTGRDGSPAARAAGAVRERDGAWITVPSSGTLRLPPGTYTVDGQVFEDAGTTLLDQPAQVLDRDTTVELDARLGRPVTVAAPAPGAAPVHAQVAIAAPGGAVASVQDDRFDGFRTARIGPGTAVGGFRTEVTTGWAAPGATSWSLGWTVPGGYPTGFARDVPGPLTEIRTAYAATAAGGTGVQVRASLGGGRATSFALPAERTEFVNTDGGVPWGAWFTDAGSGIVTAAPPARPGAGAQTWNAGPFGPDFGDGITRDGNTLTVRPSWFTDRDGRPGQSARAGHRLVVTRDGKVLSDTATPAARVSVPAAAGTFTVTDEHDGNRTKWTFESSATPAAEPVAAPVVRFTPRPDDVLAMSVRHQAGGRTTRLAVQVSYDEGRTWRTPMATRIGDRGVAFLKPPAGAGSVSVKASAADDAGNSVEQTILRAYAH